MSMAPFQVLVLPCRIVHSRAENPILPRSDAEIWQGVAGGGNQPRAGGASSSTLPHGRRLALGVRIEHVHDY